MCVGKDLTFRTQARGSDPLTEIAALGSLGQTGGISQGPPLVGGGSHRHWCPRSPRVWHQAWHSVNTRKEYSLRASRLGQHCLGHSLSVCLSLGASQAAPVKRGQVRVYFPRGSQGQGEARKGKPSSAKAEVTIIFALSPEEGFMEDFHTFLE